MHTNWAESNLSQKFIFVRCTEFLRTLALLNRIWTYFTTLNWVQLNGNTICEQWPWGEVLVIDLQYIKTAQHLLKALSTSVRGSISQELLQWCCASPVHREVMTRDARMLLKGTSHSGCSGPTLFLGQGLQVPFKPGHSNWAPKNDFLEVVGNIQWDD